jgi:glycosyltransferase involved in cell wall biosynthesis
MEHALPAMSTQPFLLTPAGSAQKQLPWRIAYCITDTDVGGAEKCLERLVTHLPRERFEPLVLSLLPEGPIAARLRAWGITMASMRLNKKNPAPGVWRLARTLRAWRPHLIHTFLFHANVTVRLLRPWLPGVPLVASLRVAEEGRSWQRWGETLTWRASDVVVAVGEGVRRFAIRHLGVSPKRVVAIPNSVDLNRVAAAPLVPRESLDLRPDHRVALFVGRLHRQKGVDLLLRAFAQAVEEVPQLRLVIAGTGPEELPLRALASSLGVSGLVRWLGWRDDVYGLMKSADFLVLPSRWEGFPHVVLEAMAANLPVVSTPVGALLDIVVPGITGLVVRTVEELSAAMVELASNPEKQHLLRQAARKRVEDFHGGQELQAYMNLYDRLLQRRYLRSFRVAAPR